MFQMRVPGYCKPKLLDAVDKMVGEYHSHMSNGGASHIEK